MENDAVRSPENSYDWPKINRSYIEIKKEVLLARKKRLAMLRDASNGTSTAGTSETIHK